MKVGFTGTQSGMTEQQKTELTRSILLLCPSEFHHGDCIGADEEAHEIANRLSLPIYIHPPKISTKRAFTNGYISYPPKPYLKRNHDIVDSVYILIACPKGKEVLRSGTWATIRYAILRKIRTIIIYPNGIIERR
ncbi:hypothetical protein ES705_09377 [subsurface metagenome]